MQVCNTEQFGWDFYQDCDDTFADWRIVNGDLDGTNQLHNAILTQLFTDRQVSEQEANRASDGFGLTSRGGFWGDYYAPFPMGSKLWLLRRAALTQDTIENARLYCLEALQPIIDQGAAARVAVSVEADPANSFMTITVTMFARDGQKVYDNKFARFWGET